MEHIILLNVVVVTVVATVPSVFGSVAIAVKYILKKWIDSMFEKNTERLKIEMQKCVEVTFRNEAVRTAVVTDTIVEANKVRLSIYKNLYAIFFEILYSRNKIINAKGRAEQNKMINDIPSKIITIRNEIFINWIYLDSLVDPLMEAQAGLLEDLGEIRAEIYGSLDRCPRDSKASSDAFFEAGQWIIKNMKTSMVLDQFEFSEDTIKKLHEESTKLIERNHTNDQRCLE